MFLDYLIFLFANVYFWCGFSIGGLILFRLGIMMERKSQHKPSDEFSKKYAHLDKLLRK